VRRLFVDGIGGFRADAIAPERITPMFTSLLTQLRGLGVTTIISDDSSEVLSGEIVPPTPHVASRVQNIILLRYVELRSQLHRLISIVKRRGGGYDRAIREFVIDDGGIAVADTFASAEAVLSGLAHPLPSGKKVKPRGKPRAKPRRRKRP
jgi:circadian clock protein KaiC